MGQSVHYLDTSWWSACPSHLVTASVVQAERDAMESGKSLPASSAAEAALREHFSGEEGDKAVQQQVCSYSYEHCRPLCKLVIAAPSLTPITQQAAATPGSHWACLYQIAMHAST